ncbi:MAG TPA: adenosylmethionine--8-amino-7-oxononanoate transaminase [Verrucomicrobiae bacterium]|nr:adenosylmethionine--8-amino-7-oxononanoate transaminase [Verrucomicrobiae bacterium]
MTNRPDRDCKSLLRDLDHRYLWHPFTQMRDWTAEEPVIVESGQGAVLRDVKGREYLDANSSIWTNLHGHQHPKITQAIKDQLDHIAHSSFLGLSNEPAIRLAEKLIQIAPAGLTRVFYSDDGSTAMEVAIKMALQYWQHRKQPGRTRFVAFADAYHGDTLGSVSVGGIDLFHAAFRPLLFDVIRANDVSRLTDLMREHGSAVAGVVIEPLVQGAAGMRLWRPGLLAELRRLCTEHGALLIADEVMTGFGRTGTMFACEQEGVTPDLMAVAKGLTGGYLPLAATLTTEDVFGAFLGDYSEFKTFFHGHSYTGNQLGCAAALANLRIFEDEQTLAKLQPKCARLRAGLEGLHALPHVGEVRHIGAIGAVELFQDVATKTPYPLAEKIGIKVCAEMRQRGVLTRPIGNSIVLMPPYCLSDQQIDRVLSVLAESIRAVVM